MNEEYKYQFVDKLNTSDVTVLSTLHSKLIPHSPVALLGEYFMEKFYYKVLPAMGLITCIVVYINNKPAGFISLTNDSSGFMKNAIKQKWMILITVLVISLIKEPKRIFAMWEAIQIMSNLPESAKRECSGELLSLGILPEYRNIKMKDSRTNLATELVSRAVSILKTQGCKEIRVVVDHDNKVAQFFYHGLGWKLGEEKIKGWRTPSIEFVLQNI